MAEGPDDGSKTRLPNAVRALRYPNYRLFYFGQGISLIGTWMQMIALSWLVQRLTGSAFMLGVVNFANRIPAAVVSPVAGAYIDRLDKHKVVIAAQCSSMVLALLLAALTIGGWVQIWHVITLSALLGIVNAIEVPARQSFFVELIEDREDLGNAIALNSSLFNSARMIGPAVAGALIAIFDEGICFLLNGLSYLAVIAALLRMNVRPREGEVQKPSVWLQMREGFRYTFGFSPIATLLALVAVVSLFGMPYAVLMPSYAEQTLGVKSEGFGMIMATGGFGALFGAVWLASRRSVRGLGKVIVTSACVYCVGITLVSHVRDLWLALLLMPLIGGGLTVMMASINTVLQTVVDDDKRGRVMSLYVLSFMGTSPFGSLLAGKVADQIGVPDTLRYGAWLVLVAAIVFGTRIPSMRRLVRPIYVSKGIISEVRMGPNAAPEASVGLRDR